MPQNTRDFSAYLLKLQQIKPDVVATAVGGDDIKALRQQVVQLKMNKSPAWINNQQDWPDVYGLGPDAIFGVFGTTWYYRLDLPGVKEFVAAYQKQYPGMAIRVPGNVYYNGYMATRELLRAVERAGTTNNLAVIKKLEGLKVSARDRMQHFDAYMNPATHQCSRRSTWRATTTRRRRRTTSSGSSPRRSRRTWRTRARPTPASSSATRRRRATSSELRAATARADDSPTTAMLQLLPHLVNGVSLGLLFALIALGFMLIVGVMETINLAHGSLFALGMYVALFLVTPRLGWFPELQAAYIALPLGTRYAIALLLAPVLVGVFGMLLELCMRRTYGKDPLYGLLLTFGAALVIEEAIRAVWGSAEKQLPLPEAISGAFLLGDLIYSRYRFFASGFACLMIGLLWLFLEKTPYGAIIKAGAHDSEMVRALGINLSRLRLFVFALGVGLAAIAGVVMAPIWGIRPQVGVDAVVPAFLIIVLGGVGSLWGAVLAGLLVGLVVGLTGAYASEWSLLSMYLLFIAVVTFRSRGLFGKKSVLDT